MDKQPRKYEDNTRVRLKDGVHASFYEERGLAGNEGWIRKHKKEKYGYNKVYIEWDKDHWSYNGTEDGWTWEDHFLPANNKLEENAMPEKEEKQPELDVAGISEAIAKVIAEKLQSSAPVKTEEPTDEDLKFVEEEDFDISSEYATDEEEQDFDETLDEAFKAAKESEAFLIITINKESIEALGPHKQIAMPMVYHNAKEAESGLLTYLYMSQLSADFTLRMVSDHITAAKEIKEDEEDAEE